MLEYVFEGSVADALQVLNTSVALSWICVLKFADTHWDWESGIFWLKFADTHWDWESGIFCLKFVEKVAELHLSRFFLVAPPAL